MRRIPNFVGGTRGPDPSWAMCTILQGFCHTGSGHLSTGWQHGAWLQIREIFHDWPIPQLRQTSFPRRNPKCFWHFSLYNPVGLGLAKEDAGEGGVYATFPDRCIRSYGFGGSGRYLQWMPFNTEVHTQ